MALYLDDQTRPYLERLFKDIKDTDFIGKRIVKMLEADRERLVVIGSCEHEVGEYIGEKKCCVKCGSGAIKGCFESWNIKNGEGLATSATTTPPHIIIPNNDGQAVRTRTQDDKDRR